MADFAPTLARDRAMLEQALKEAVAFPPVDYGRVGEAMAYSLLGGGKRLRGVLVLAFCRLFGGEEQAALPFACAIEMIHAYSLIHDDLPCMDDDDLRRGKPSCHIAYGEAMALLAGDSLLTYAFETALSAPHLPMERRGAIALELARAAGISGMIGGQVLDIESHSADVEALTRLCSLKTGALIRAAAKIGALAAGAGEGELAAADRYAQKLGLSFQITDDILDTIGDEAVLGKPIGSDADNQKTTFVTLLGLQGARELSHRLLQEALEELGPYAGPGDFLPALTASLADRNK